MKKRKELDALVANGKVRKKSNGCGSGHSSSHELLRVADSDTTDTEEFSAIQTRKSHPKKAFSLHRLCTACVPLCVFTLITASIVGLGTLLWLQLGLRGEVDLLRDHLRQVEDGSRGTPLQFHDLHTDMKQLVGNNTAFHADIAKLNLTLITITKGVDDILKRVALLEQKAGNHTELGRLPDQVKTITDAVASVGSKLLDLEDSVTKLKSDTSNQNLKASYTTLEADVKSVKLSQVNSVTHEQLNQALQNAFASMNSTLATRLYSAVEELVDKNGRFSEVNSLIHNLTVRIGVLESAAPGQFSFNQTNMEKLNEIVQNRLNITLTKMAALPNSQSMMATNGSVNLREMSNYIKNLSNLYVAIISKLQKGPDTLALNSSLNVNFTLNVEDIVNEVVLADRQQLKKLQTDFDGLQVSFEALKGAAENNVKKLAVIESAIEKISLGNTQPPLASPNIPASTASLPSGSQPAVVSNSTSNNNSSSPATIAEPPNQNPPKKPTKTGASLNAETNKPGNAAV